MTVRGFSWWRVAGLLAAVPALTWLALTCVPIFVTPVVALSRGHLASFAVYGPIGAVFVASIVFLVLELRRLREAVGTLDVGAAA